jgi:type VI secretion system secreted protein Hcp
MAFDAFIKIDGIPGESTAKGKADNMDIYSFSWGASNPTTVSSGGGLGAGKVSISGFNFMKKSDKASPLLFLACCSGTHIASAVVTLRKAGGDTPLDYITYKFTDLMVESIQWSGSSGGDDAPTESVSLAFTKAETEFQPQNAKGAKEGGAITSSWDVKKNAKS